MKFHLSHGEGNVVTGVGPGWVRVGVREFRENIAMNSTTIAPGWTHGGFEQLAETDFKALLDLDPEIVVLGTGATIRFPHPKLTRALTEAHVGVEVMDTAAACRTYNILAAEGRKVAVALLIEPAR